MKKLQMFIFGLGLLAATGVMLSCQKEPVPEQSPDEQIGRIIFSVDSEDSDVFMKKESTIGLFLVKENDGQPVRFNEMMIVGERGETAPERDTVVGSSVGYLYAYSPYDPSWNDALESVKEFSVMSDQSAELDYAGSDLVWAVEVKTGAPSTKIVMTHALARVMVHMTSHIPEKDMRNVRLSLCGVKTNSHVYLPQKSLKTDDQIVSDIRCHVIESKDRRSSHSAVIPPQIMDGGYLDLKIEMDGDTYDYGIQVPAEFESGRLYTYVVRIADNGFVLEGSSVSDWTDGENSVLDFDQGQL